MKVFKTMKVLRITTIDKSSKYIWTGIEILRLSLSINTGRLDFTAETESTLSKLSGGKVG